LCAPDDKRRKSHSFAQATAKSFGSSSGTGRGKSSSHKPHGSRKEPAADPFDDDGTSGDGLPSSRVDVGLHRVGKEKPRERPIMIQVPRKRKGPNAKV
jgi:hypothetical protein